MKWFALSVAIAFLIACGSKHDSSSSTGTPTDSLPGMTSLPSCGASTALFTVSPVPLADLLGWVPLGNLNPPGHQFPTDHQYLYINNPENASTVRPVNVVAPGHITITSAHRTHYSLSNTNDYALAFSPCAEVFGEFGHVTTLVPAVLDQLGAFDQECGSYTLGSNVFTNCFTRRVAVELNAGDPIGTTGGLGTSFALDFLLRDNRVTPTVYANSARWGSGNFNGNDIYHVVPASDYYAEPARSTIRARLGAFNGSTLRTVEPLGGTIAYDRAGTAQGIWINPSQATFPEGPHLAFAPDNVNPSRLVVSMGTSQPGFPPGIYSYIPASTGFVNRHPLQLTPDGNIYCFEFPGNLGVILMQLEDAVTLRVDGRPDTTTCALQQPWAFSANAFRYKR